VEGASSIVVGLWDGSIWEATLVGVARDKDIAVLRFKAPKDQLAPLPIGDSDQLEVGRKVLAIGNPFGLDSTLTTGIVSALGREITAPSGRTIKGVVQTDAAINPGNSGGPLLDSQGRMIGMNTAIIGPGGGSSGIGFAVPSNILKKVVPELIKFGREIRPVMGVSIIDDQIARRFGVDGVVVQGVQRGSGAAEAGLIGMRRTADGKIVLGDVILSVGGIRVRGTDDFLNALEQYRPGDVVEVATRRENQSQNFQVRLGEPP
jgi:S1-C subfamily serine protease